MRLAEYVENYSGAPLDIREFADGATEVTNCVPLVQAAEEYIKALDAFSEVLEQYNVTIG